MSNRRISTIFIALVLLASAAMAANKAAPRQNSFLDWGDSPEAYLLTSAERGEWLMVTSQSQADAFVANYWAKHGRAFHAEVMARIAAADKYFPLADRKGSTTERGRVFIVLGAPNRQQSNRNDNVASTQTFQGTPNSIEQRAVAGVVWVYKNDRLPKDLGVAELTVKFQTDVSRGYETIENPGLIEPYLKRAADYFVKNWKAPAGETAAAPVPTPTQQKAAVGASPLPPDDAVWGAPAALNGAIVTGDAYLSPTDKPFYAVNFYLPKGSFAEVGDLTVAGVIRDSSGQQVASVRTPAKAAQYDANGDRFVDASFELPAGHYTGAFALAAADGKLLASTHNEFDVMPAEHVGISKVLMTSRVDTLEKQAAFDPFTFVAMKYAVKGDRRFRSADKIGYFAIMANPTAAPAPSMSMKMKVSKDGKLVDPGSWMPVDLAQTGPHTYLLATQFEPNALSPGHYALEVQLRDMKADKTSEAFTKGYFAKAEFDVVQ
jgi:GWxTD domain-containing protein